MTRFGQIPGLPRVFASVLALLWLGPWLEARAAEGPCSIWKVQGKQGTIYLAGTVHLLRPQDHPLPAAYRRAYDLSQRVVFEVDLKVLDAPETRFQLLELSMLPEGVRLQDRLSPPVYVKLKAYLKKAGMEGDYLDRLNPGMMAMTVTALEAGRLGARADLGVEQVLGALAKQDGKPTSGLETPDFQMKLFDRLSAAEQEELLRLNLEQIGDMGKELDELIRAWKHGETGKLHDVLNRHFEGQERLTQVILEDRNRAWLPAMEEALNGVSGSTLYLVGVAHLVGEAGVVRLLEQKGYAVSQWTGQE